MIQYVPVSEAAEHFGISENNLRQRISQGKVKSKKAGAKRLVAIQVKDDRQVTLSESEPLPMVAKIPEEAFGSVSVKTTEMTPEMATKIMANAAPNRGVRQNAVERMASEMVAGRWILNGSTIVLTSEGQLLDGQHRLLACIKAGVPFKTTIVTGMPIQAMDSIDQGKSRTNSDILKLHGIPNYTIASAASRYLWQMEKFKQIVNAGGPTNPPRSEVLRMYRKARGLDHSCAMARTVTNAAGRGFHLSGSVIAACHYLFTQAAGAEKADEFLVLLKEGGSPGAASKDPIRLLWKRGFDRYTVRGARVYASLMIKAWNAWRRGETTEILHYRQGEAFPEIEA